MTDARRSGPTGVFAGVSLWAVWAVSALPFFVLFIEFRGGELGECGREWWYYARFYSHFFLYPVTFGLVSTALLHRPWVRTVHHLRSLPEPARTRKVGLIAVSILAVVGFAGYVEFSGGHSSSAFENCKPLFEEGEGLPEFSGATPAPWSIAPGAMETGEEGLRVHALLAKRCRIASDSSYGRESPSPLLDEKEKCEFQQKMSTLWRDGDGPRSFTEDFYRAGFLAMTALFALLFATIFVTTTRYSRDGMDAEARKDPEIGSMMSLLGVALIFATFWVLMRITFLAEKLSIYPEDPLLIFNWFILLAFVAIYVHLVTRLWPASGPIERSLNLGLTILGLVIGIIGLVGETFSLEWIPKALIGVFGTGGTLSTYVAVLLLLLVVHFPHLLRLLERNGSDHSGHGA